ncbi:isoaspartyl peptidase/L-asparaginase family protein [Luminiphilus sp. nBUS_16]|uniref:isoaspartyl peptidase/L-asparaginase family protein n=1 Tax=Luminiphilus sp. nBUS_16 TaxID=3395315 RepID=UPI003EBC4D56
MFQLRRLLLLLGLLGLVPGAFADPIAIAIHGGAGTLTRDSITPEQERDYLAILNTAVQQGHARLQDGATGSDVVRETIRLLENSPLFNAGHGAVLTWNGTHELDASMMLGHNLAAGAVAGVTRVKNPIEAAYAVLEYSPHVLLSGAGADKFAESQGLTMVDNRYFTTPRRVEALELFRAKYEDKKAQNGDEKFGTVGVVVLDTSGNLAAGTSTGGMTGKRWGRIGDSPLIGSGTFADNRSCAVSATGHGEFFIRWQVASDICARVRYQGLDLLVAANQVLHDELALAGGEGGVIAIDPKGNVALVFNTEGMYRASINAAGEKVVGIYRSHAGTQNKEQDLSDG